MKTFLLSILGCLLLSQHTALAMAMPDGDDGSEGEIIYFDGLPTDPTTAHNGPHRAPVQYPLIYINGYNLYFGNSCDGCTLSIHKFNEETPVYSTTIPAGTDVLQIPAYIEEGRYELRIIRGNYCFSGVTNIM